MKKKLIKYIIPFFLSLTVAVLSYFSLVQTDLVKQQIKIEITLDSYQKSELQFFVEDNKQFKVEHLQSFIIPENVTDFKLDFVIPAIATPERVRIDPSLTRGKWRIKRIAFVGLKTTIDFKGQQIIDNFVPNSDIKYYQLDSTNNVFLESVGEDSHLLSLFNLSQYSAVLAQKPILYLLPFIFSLCVSLLSYYAFYKKLKPFLNQEFTLNHWLLLIFITIISTPYLVMTFFPSNTTTENRVLTEKPVFNFPHLVEYPKRYVAYFDDNIGLKKTYTTLNSLFKYQLFNSSSKPELVAVGKESWLYSTSIENAGDFKNEKLYTAEELLIIKKNIEEMQAFHEPKGIHFFIMILPIKSSIYPEYLPSFIKKKSEISKLNQVVKFMNATSKVKIIDMTDELLAAKPHTQVYYKHDLHWNFEGGYLAYKKLMERMAVFNPDLAPLPLSHYKKLFRYKYNADLSTQLSLENYLPNEEWYYEPKDTFAFSQVAVPTYENTPVNQPTVRTQIKKSKLPKAVVYRDSYFNLLVPFFSDKFSDCIYLWTNEMTNEIIDKETPGYVVLEITEAAIDKLLEDNPAWLKSK